MKTTIGLVAAMVTCALTACTVPVEPDPEVDETGEAADGLLLFCYDGNPCTTDALVSGVAGNFCTYKAANDGLVCGGNADNDVHGECYSGACLWTNWTCANGGAGTGCGEGNGVCTSDGVCCSGCISASSGACLECFGVLYGATCPVDTCGGA